jgi:hypothetical protein
MCHISFPTLIELPGDGRIIFNETCTINTYISVDTLFVLSSGQY